MSPRLFVFAALVVLFACSNQPADPADRNETVIEVDARAPFRLRAGEIASLDGGLMIAFRRVSGDSRCPSDVVCVWGGDATVRLDVTIGRMAWTAADLHTNLEPRATAFRDYTIRLVELAPYPRSDQTIRPGDYIATLEVARR